MKAILAVLGFTLAIALTACGGDDISQDDLDQAAADAVEEAEQQDRVEKLERKLDRLEDDRDSDSSSSSSSSGSGTEDCGGGVSVNAATTSCAFGLNVAEEYSIGGESEIVAYSPATGETYSMTCLSSSTQVVCRGGNSAVVYLD